MTNLVPKQGAPEGATLIAFPLDRDIGRIRRVARMLVSQKSQRAADAYWRASVCDRLAAAMTRNGIADEEVARQLEAFSLAVSAEMGRLSSEERRSPGGAA